MSAGVPDLSAEWYRQLVGFAHDMPTWLRGLTAFATSGLLALFAILFLVAVWRARSRGVGAMTLAWGSPVPMVLAYLASEWLKNSLHQPRPCRTVPDIAPTLLDCPPVSDWSLPSNHSAFAAAAAVALAVAWRPCMITAPLIAVLEALTRVLVGAHYPHDVLVGLVLGAGIAAVFMFLASKTLAPLAIWIARRTATSAPSTVDVQPADR